MKINSITTTTAAALLASTAVAQLDSPEKGDILNGVLGGIKDSQEPIESSTKPEHPQWTPLDLGSSETVVFFEQFGPGAEERWKPSHAKKDDEFSYVGEWKFEEPSVYPGFKGDRGLVVKSPAAHHAISAKLPKPLDNTGKTLVAQYEVKLQKGLECGGAYMKLLSENAELHAEEFSNETPYQIMFGPDKCGTTNKVHVIIKRKNPYSGEYEEKHLALPPPARMGQTSNLYTLVIHPNQEFEVRINGDVVRAGNLIEPGTFKPSFDAPEEIVDEQDVKPDDWADEPLMDDPDRAEKPEDWDENAPLQIPDPDAEMPEEWDEDMEQYIPDPTAEKPEDWDDEEDGEWIAPMIPNPDCVDGCGPWEAPLIRNPNYKGKWVQPKIDNPNYKGEWKPRMIANPNYYEDKTPSNLEPIGAIGFELWTMQKDILFDNIYLGHSVEEAEFIGNSTFIPKSSIEEGEAELNAPAKPKEQKKYSSAMEFFKDDPVGYVTEVARVFILNLSVDPIQAIKDQPVPALVLATILSLTMAISISILTVILYVIKTYVFGVAEDGCRASASSTKKDSTNSQSKNDGATDAGKSTSATSSTTEAKKRT